MMPRTTRGDRRRRARPVRRLTVGHDAIDADHDAIAECCSEIAEATSTALEFQLHRLRTLLANHFQHEELLLRQAGSRLCDCHTRDHALFLELCDKAILENRGQRKNSRRMILRELLPALREHIAFRDQLIALHLNTMDAKPVATSRPGSE